MKTSPGQDVPTLLFEACEREDVSYAIAAVTFEIHFRYY